LKIGVYIINNKNNSNNSNKEKKKKKKKKKKKNPTKNLFLINKYKR